MRKLRKCLYAYSHALYLFEPCYLLLTQLELGQGSLDNKSNKKKGLYQANLFSAGQNVSAKYIKTMISMKVAPESGLLDLKLAW